MAHNRLWGNGKLCLRQGGLQSTYRSENNGMGGIHITRRSLHHYLVEWVHIQGFTYRGIHRYAGHIQGGLHHYVVWVTTQNGLHHVVVVDWATDMGVHIQRGLQTAGRGFTYRGIYR
jgi:hypothetical protein